MDGAEVSVLLASFSLWKIQLAGQDWYNSCHLGLCSLHFGIKSLCLRGLFQRPCCRWCTELCSFLCTGTRALRFGSGLQQTLHPLLEQCTYFYAYSGKWVIMRSAQVISQTFLASPWRAKAMTLWAAHLFSAWLGLLLHIVADDAREIWFLHASSMDPKQQLLRHARQTWVVFAVPLGPCLQGWAEPGPLWWHGGRRDLSSWETSCGRCCECTDTQLLPPRITQLMIWGS